MIRTLRVTRRVSSLPLRSPLPNLTSKIVDQYSIILSLHCLLKKPTSASVIHSSPMKPNTVFLLLGSNLGEKKLQIDKAIGLIGEKIGPIIKQSSIYETEPWGFSSEDYFLNKAVQLTTFLSPQEILPKITEIEEQLGRIRSIKVSDKGAVKVSGEESVKVSDEESVKASGIKLVRGYSSRTMDIDILFYNNLIIDREDLIIPHPQIQNRRFALVPMNEIAKDLIHPSLKKSIHQLLISCPDTSKVIKLQ